MATPVVASTATNTGNSSNSLTISAPSSIATNDLLVAYFLTAINDLTHNTPSGWTKLFSINGTTDGEFSVYAKVAVSADESAPNYTFTASGSADFLAGCILRITGAGAAIPTLYDDAYDASGGTSFSEAVSVTPIGTDALLLMAFGAVDVSTTSVMTASAQASTPTKTWTEQLDFGYTDGISNAIAINVSTASESGTTEITNIACTFSECDRGSFGSLILISEANNASGTAALLNPDTTIFSEASVVVGTSGSNDLLNVQPTYPTAVSTGTTPTQWTTTTKS